MAHTLSPRDLVFVYASHTPSALIAYLACLKVSAVAVMLNPELSEDKKRKLTSLYQPNVMFCDERFHRIHDSQHQICPDLALMLTTSGSTGSAKFVGLSFKNVQSNAQAIGKYLPISCDDTTLANLPLFYSYGLSIVNSHLYQGACVYLSALSPMQRAFWQLLEDEPINSIAGVPHTYDMLARLKFTQKALPDLRYFTQAGGKLSVALARQLAEYAKQTGKLFFIMYGQTEATARIAYLDPEKAGIKPDSIGRPIPGGKLFLLDAEDQAAVNVAGELGYKGDNVMLGYVESLNDLTKFEENDCLATGDIGYRDEAGDWYITGRAKRFVKLFGERVNLDEVESWLEENGVEAACCGSENALQIFTTSQSSGKTLMDIKNKVSHFLNVHISAINVIDVEAIPLTANGKRDYPKLETIGASVK